MRVELRQDRLVIILTEAESNFLAHKADQSGQKDICSYVKAKILKALDLKAFEDEAMVDLANNFNLAKIKHVSTELNQRKSVHKKDTKEDDANLMSEQDLVDLLEEESAEEIEIGDELLADLLDKDLLAKKPKVGADAISPPKKPKKPKK